MAEQHKSEWVAPATGLNCHLLDLLIAEDLPPDIRLIHDACGMVVVKLLLAHLGGGRFYIPKPVSLDKLLERYIRNVMTEGADVRLIAARLGVSVEKVKSVAHRVGGGA